MSKTAIIPASDLAEAKVRLLRMLQEAVDASWKDEYREEGEDTWIAAEKAVLRQVAALLGATPEEIRATDQHSFAL